MSFRLALGKPVILAAMAALSGCSAEEENRAASMTPDQLRREIEAVRELKPQDAPSSPSVLQPGDWKEEHGEPGCSFVQQGGVILLANGGHAVLRLKNRVVSLKAAGPVDRSTGFFAAGPVSVSVGIIEKSGSRAGASRMAVRTPAATQPTLAEGKWTCM